MARQQSVSQSDPGHHQVEVEDKPERPISARDKVFSVLLLVGDGVVGLLSGPALPAESVQAEDQGERYLVGAKQSAGASVN